MHPLKIIALFIGILLSIHTIAQTTLTYDEVNTKSYALYEKGSWKELLVYGKEAVEASQDFTLLRLRMGYAAFMLNNFSEAINQYEHVLKNDSYNSSAHYYLYLAKTNLNKSELAGTHIKYLSKEIIEQERIKSFALTSIGVEVSYKQTDALTRDNPIYTRLHLGNRLSNNVYLTQSVATYNQTLNEQLLVGVTNKNNISINQFEYYNKLTINLNTKWQLKAGYHFVYTPFNNLVFNNNLFLGGIKYNSNFFDVQADAIVGNVNDSSFNQYNLQLGYYPLGNLNVYGFSTFMLKPNTANSFNFKQVIGFKLIKNIWLEANATLGKFTNLAENDMLYLYNAIDANNFKGGVVTHFLIGKKTNINLGYTFEQRQFYKRTTTFNQHSITGGLSWKF